MLAFLRRERGPLGTGLLSVLLSVWLSLSCAHCLAAGAGSPQAPAGDTGHAACHQTGDAGAADEAGGCCASVPDDCGGASASALTAETFPPLVFATSVVEAPLPAFVSGGGGGRLPAARTHLPAHPPAGGLPPYLRFRVLLN